MANSGKSLQKNVHPAPGQASQGDQQKSYQDGHDRAAAEIG
jgi:hypothetical protein